MLLANQAVKKFLRVLNQLEILALLTLILIQIRFTAMDIR